MGLTWHNSWNVAIGQKWTVTATRIA